MESSNDALTLALGTPEHRRHVRGIRVGVTHTSYFHTPTQYVRPKQTGNQKSLMIYKSNGIKGSKPKSKIQSDDGRDESTA